MDLKILKRWQQWASPSEQSALALAAGTSIAYLFDQIAGGHRRISAALAARIEQASEPLCTASDGRLPEIRRENLCQTCAECPLALAARKSPVKN